MSETPRMVWASEDIPDAQTVSDLITRCEEAGVDPTKAEVNADDDGRLYLSFQRPETDAEREYREAREALAEMAERRSYERLKAKYEAQP